MDTTLFLYALGVAALASALPKVKSRLELSKAKHPSLAGHSNLSRRIAKLIPFYEYGEARFFCCDDAPEAIAARRRAGFMRLAEAGRARQPRDAIIGACGRIEDATLFQAKGFPYALEDLLGSAEWARHYRNGCYATLRLTSSMYHRFHAPHTGVVKQVAYFSGDVWNVNPIALKRIKNLFCKNEHAAIQMELDAGKHLITLVPVAAILVASIRLHFLDVLLHLNYRGPHLIPCQAAFGKGEEMGWFQHGSSMIVLAPEGFELAPEVRDGALIRVGRPLLRLPAG